MKKKGSKIVLYDPLKGYSFTDEERKMLFGKKKKKEGKKNASNVSKS